MPNPVGIQALTDECSDPCQRFGRMEHEVFEADLQVVRAKGASVAPTGLDLPHPVQRGNIETVIAIPGKGPNELPPIQCEGHVPRVTHHMNEKRFRNLPFDFGEIQEIVRSPHRPALVSAASRHRCHHGCQELATAVDRRHHGFGDLAGVQAGTPELPAAKPAAHQPPTCGGVAKVSESGNQKIKDHGLSPVDWKMPGSHEHLIKHRVPRARGAHDKNRRVGSGRHH